MSAINEECQIIDFAEKKREHILKILLEKDILPPEVLADLMKAHEFLRIIDNDLDLPNEELIVEIESEIRPFREKFEVIFEFMKKELII